MSKHRRALKRRGPFVTPLFRYPGKGRVDVCTYPEDAVAPVTRPWGRTPVSAVVDAVSWDTSVGRDTKTSSTLLAVPLRVRGSKRSGDTVTVEFTFEGEEDD
jgi:hypothetical protein